jgi:hypothetical protein
MTDCVLSDIAGIGRGFGSRHICMPRRWVSAVHPEYELSPKSFILALLVHSRYSTPLVMTWSRRPTSHRLCVLSTDHFL